MKNEYGKVSISAVCGAVLLGGVTLLECGFPKDNMTIPLYKVQKSIYSKLVDEEGNDNLTKQSFEPEYLTIKEIDESKALEIVSKSTWEKVDAPFWAKKGTYDYARIIYTAKFPQEEIDNNFLDSLVEAFEQGQINDLTKDSVENYCQKYDLSMIDAVSSWDNWKVEGQCNENNIIDFSERENFAFDTMTVMQVDYDNSITRPATSEEKAMGCLPIVLVSAMGALGAVELTRFVDEKKQNMKSKKI